MPRKVLILAIVVMLSVPAALGQEPQPPVPQEPPLPQEPSEPAGPPPRVVGQAQTQEELDAYSQISAAEVPDEFIRLSHQFLQQYPDSGLTPFVHYNLSNAYRRNNDPENFIVHGEKALRELPVLPDVLAYLAFFYSEKGNLERAVECAQKTTEVLGKMTQPDAMTARVWAAQKFALNAEAHYAMGRVALSEATSTDPPTPDKLTDAVRHLEQALEQSPNHPYAAFRLAEAYSRQQAYEQAISSYARTVAMGGVIGEYARPSLQRVYEFVHKGTDGLAEEVARQKEILEKSLAERQQLLDQIAAEEQEAQESLQTPVARPPVG